MKELTGRTLSEHYDVFDEYAVSRVRQRNLSCTIFTYLYTL